MCFSRKTTRITRDFRPDQRARENLYVEEKPTTQQILCVWLWPSWSNSTKAEIKQRTKVQKQQMKKNTLLRIIILDFPTYTWYVCARQSPMELKRVTNIGYGFANHGGMNECGCWLRCWPACSVWRGTAACLTLDFNILWAGTEWLCNRGCFLYV